jgi:RNA polymerase sigma-70 factor, ECF subfamily
VAAFEAIVLTYARPLTAFAWRYLKSADAAADLVQDAFAHLWEHRAQLRVRGSLRGYLYAATRNRALNVLEHQRIEARWREGARAAAARRGAAAVAVPRSTLPDAILESAELGATVHDALRSLPPRAREIARLRWIERLSQREIAQALGIAVPTVSAHLTRTAKRLRALLAGVWP